MANIQSQDKGNLVGEETKMSDSDIKAQQQASNFDFNDSDYRGYYKFVDDAYFKQLVQEISPGFKHDGPAVS